MLPCRRVIHFTHTPGVIRYPGGVGEIEAWVGMRRREFIAGIGAAAAWPLAARAQRAGKLPRIGFLGADPTAFSPWTAAFVARMRELGWIENQSVAIEYRWSEGRTERYAEIAAEFVRLKVDVIVTVGSAVPTVLQAASSTPIVFAVAIDPVGNGLVASLAKPGGNVTGLSLQAANLAGKRIELLREVVPRLSRLAIIFNVGNAQPVLEMRETDAAARTLGIEVKPIEIRRVEDFGPAFRALGSSTDALYVAIDQLMVANLVRVLTLALGARLPTVFSTNDFVRGGGFISYGPSYIERFRRAADYVDKILRGAKPGDIPVEQPTKFELAINLITAQALGLTIPPAFLARADEVIE
jgi:putative tryptophan/tyrosine transport system substrate-binding protein